MGFFSEDVCVAMAAEGGDVIPEATIQEVLRHAMVVDGLSRGLREAVKALDKYVTHKLLHRVQ